MEIGWIAQDTVEVFHTLLLPETAQALAQGTPVLALGLTQGDTACGAVAGQLSGPVFFLQSLYVAPNFRRLGGGRSLIKTLCTLLQDRCTGLEIHYTITQLEHQLLSPFLTAIGFLRLPDSEETLYGLTVDRLKNSAFFAKGGKAAPAVCPFEALPPALLTQSYRAALASGEAYLPVPLTDPVVDQAVSMALLDKKAVRSFAAFVSPRPGLLSLAWVQSGHPQDLPALLLAAFAQVQKRYAPETLLTVQAITPASAALIQALIPEADPISRTYYYKM